MKKQLLRFLSVTLFGAAVAITGQIYLAEAKPTPPAEVEMCAQPEAAPMSEMTPAAATQSTWQWQGCWGWFGTTCPYDIYRNAAGQYVRCNGCTSGTNPNPGSCASISTQSLNVGRW